MILTTFFRRTTLHLSQIFFTEGRTFIVLTHRMRLHGAVCILTCAGT